MWVRNTHLLIICWIDKMEERIWILKQSFPKCCTKKVLRFSTDFRLLYKLMEWWALFIENNDDRKLLSFAFTAANILSKLTAVNKGKTWQFSVIAFLNTLYSPSSLYTVFFYSWISLFSVFFLQIPFFRRFPKNRG